MGKYRRVGVIGSSAGGHLTATALTQFRLAVEKIDAVDDQSARPDFGILCYPVISFLEFTHQGSAENLLGKDPSQDLRLKHSHDRNVTVETPPTFLWHTAEDQAVPAENSMLFAKSLSRDDVPYELHIYQNGHHGIGLGPKSDHPWGAALLAWLEGL